MGMRMARLSVYARQGGAGVGVGAGEGTGGDGLPSQLDLDWNFRDDYQAGEEIFYDAADADANEDERGGGWSGGRRRRTAIPLATPRAVRLRPGGHGGDGVGGGLVVRRGGGTMQAVVVEVWERQAARRQGGVGACAGEVF